VTTNFAPLNPPRRILLGPGPSDVSDRILRALAAPTIGHLDPEYLKMMDDVRVMMREVFKTKNELTLAVSGTGMAGMECILTNLLEQGDEMLVCVNGVFGGRMADMAARQGANVQTLEIDWGKTFEPQQIADALKAKPGTRLVGIVHAETSTGAHQPIEEISKVVHDAGALLVLDTVTSLSGVDVRIDDWKVDACYSATQKCLACPPGLSPVTFSAAAEEKIKARKTKPISWYLDVTMVRDYWGSARAYHHTAPINMTYALREALMIILEEGLDARFARHLKNHKALRAGLAAMGISYIPERSLPTLNCIRVPNGIDDAKVRGQLLNDYGIEIGAGLGPFKGTAWRIGLMGESSSQRNVLLVLAALEAILGQQGFKMTRGSAVEAAAAEYA